MSVRPPESQNILVSGNIWFITKFDRGRPEQGRSLRLGWVQTGDFGNFSTNKPPYLPKRCKTGPRLLLITNRKSHTRFRFVPKSTTLDDPELTSNGYYALCCIALNTFSKPTTKIWMKIDPYYQRHKCIPGIAVSSEIKFMWIFTGVRWSGGFKWELGHLKWRFLHILPAISSEPSRVRQQILCYVAP